MNPLDLAPYKVLIKERCGLLFEEACEEKLVEALRERSAALGIAAAAYYPRLVSDGTEFQAMVNLLTINETYFFREPEQIRLLVEHLAPSFLAAHNGLAPVRILSAGCSSGEEPYSLAMALMEKYGSSVARLFAFSGGDIDSAVLAKARAARYTDFSFRGVSTEIRQRYFDRDRWGNLLKDEVRKLVSFHEINLLATEFSAELQGFDIVFFRNVSIYFDAPTRKLIQQNLARLMKENGILVIGTAETLANDLGVLPLVEVDGLFYFVKGNPPLPEQAARIESKPLGLPAAPAAIRREPAPPLPPLLVLPGDWHLPAVLSKPTFGKVTADLAQARQEVRDKHYATALPLLDAVLFTEPGNIEAQLLKAHVLLERKEFTTAEALARQVQAIDEWSIDALLLLGLAAKWRDSAEEAIRWFKLVVYACHECWPAHYFLADLLRASGAVEPAQRAYRVVIQLLSNSAPDTGIRYLPLELPAGEMRFLCERQLARLSTGKTLTERG